MKVYLIIITHLLDVNDDVIDQDLSLIEVYFTAEA